MITSLSLLVMLLWMQSRILLCCSSMLLIYIHLFVHQDPQVSLSQTAPQPLGLRPALRYLVIPSQVQDLIFAIFQASETFLSLQHFSNIIDGGPAAMSATSNTLGWIHHWAHRITWAEILQEPADQLFFDYWWVDRCTVIAI